jgi:hypothetical protein
MSESIGAQAERSKTLNACGPPLTNPAENKEYAQGVAQIEW